MRDNFIKDRFLCFFFLPSVISFLVMTFFYIIFNDFLHPSFAIKDDLQIISIASGYPAGDPAPFLVYSNVLLGFLLTRLYAIHTSFNWEILLFTAINFLSLWGLLFILLKKSNQTRNWLFEGIFLLAGAAYFTLNITYTNVALLASFSGICLILTSARSSNNLQKAPFFGGISLVLAGSLIRIEMLALILPVTFFGLIFIARSINIKFFVLGCIITGLLVGALYTFDKYYVRSNPDWNNYYSYNKARQSLDDSHRLDNLHNEIRHIGWSGNDQELFARWFFPDQGIYSLDHIQYLNNHIAPTSGNLFGSVPAFLNILIRPQPAAYLIIMAAIMFWMLSQIPSVWQAITLLSIWAIGLGENLFLIWAYKDPDYVLMSSIICFTIYGLVVLPPVNGDVTNHASFSRNHPTLSRLAFSCSLLFSIVGIGWVLGQSLESSNINMDKEIAYQRILDDLGNLQRGGIISENAIIMSPAHGLPMEWSNPFVLEFPKITYFDTGWITFSPVYEHVLQKFDIGTLPDALYQKTNLYLITKWNFTLFLARYYQEHENITVTFQSIYTMPNNLNLVEYNDIHLYRVVKLK